LETEIKIRHLFTHTSGLGYGIMGGPIEDLYASQGIFSPIFTFQCSVAELVQKLPGLPLCAQPGTIWSYSFAHDVLGYIVEAISGKSLDVFLQERIFDPLGMTDTGFFVPPEKLDRFGPMYKARGDESALMVADDVANSPFVSPAAVHSGGGGLVSTMPDYYRFASMLANGGELEGVRLIKPGTFAAMTTNQLPATAYGEGRFAASEGYGLGLGVRLTADPALGLPVGAFGWGGSSGTRMLVCPREELIEICMVQAFVDFGASETLLKLAFAAITN
jgi:CubicO group peptidase (beta-lactamase class C family)